jgi:hypothetical protein
MTSSSPIRERLKTVWPYIVAAVMIGYVTLLAALVADDVGATSAVLRLS